MTILQFYPEHCIAQRLENSTILFNQRLFRHKFGSAKIAVFCQKRKILAKKIVIYSRLLIKKALQLCILTYPQCQKTTNPVSRILFPVNTGSYHLSGINITAYLLLPTLEPSTEALNGPLSKIPIHGITTPGVYPQQQLPAATVSSYLTFSPFPVTGSYFLWHWPSSLKEPALNRRVALCCPDFPQQLSLLR